MDVYDPINLEKLPFNDYLNNDNDNIVIIYDNQLYGINKTLLTPNNEMKLCKIKNNNLLKQETYKDKTTYFNIGYFFNKKILVDVKILNKLIKTNKIFNLTSTTTDQYINLEFLKQSTIGLTNLTPSNKKNIPIKDDVYFDELMSTALRIYSSNLYFYINRYLLNNDFLDKDGYLSYHVISYVKKHLKKDIKTIKDIKPIILQSIYKIDLCFIEAAPRFENTKVKTFYRGMKTHYTNVLGNKLLNIGEKTLVTNFTSITVSKVVAKGFGSIIYEFLIDDGMPYINMITNTEYKAEKEILLPRNIILTLVDIKDGIYVVKVEPSTSAQFKIKTGCIEMMLGNLSVQKKISFVKEPKFIFSDFGKNHYTKNNTDVKRYIKHLEDNYMSSKSSTTTNKHFIILVGKPGAGKSYFIKNNLESKFGLSYKQFVNLNPDDLRYFNKDFVNEISGKLDKSKDKLPKQDFVVNDITISCYPNKDEKIVANIYATENTLNAIRDSMQSKVIPYFLKQDKNIIYDSACANATFCGQLLRQAKDYGFTPSIICVDAPSEIAFKRAKDRQQYDGRYMSDAYLNHVYKTFDIKTIKDTIVKSSNIKDFYKILDNNTQSIAIKEIEVPKLKRCEKGKRRHPVTKLCVDNKQILNKPKLPRCPNKHYRDPVTKECVKK